MDSLGSTSYPRTAQMMALTQLQTYADQQIGGKSCNGNSQFGASDLRSAILQQLVMLEQMLAKCAPPKYPHPHRHEGAHHRPHGPVRNPQMEQPLVIVLAPQNGSAAPEAAAPQANGASQQVQGSSNSLPGLPPPPPLSLNPIDHIEQAFSFLGF